MANPDQPCDCNDVARILLLSSSVKVGKYTTDSNLDANLYGHVREYRPRLSGYHMARCVCTHCLKVADGSKDAGMWHNARDQRALQIIHTIYSNEYTL